MYLFIKLLFKYLKMFLFSKYNSVIVIVTNGIPFIIKSIVSDWENITQDNKKTIFDYLIIMNEMVEKFNL